MMNNKLQIYQQFLKAAVQENQYLSNLLNQLNKQVIPYSFSHFNSEEQLQQQLHNQINHFNLFKDDLEKYSQDNEIPIESVFDSYWNYVLPYFNHLISVKQEKGLNSIISGVLGVQGAGKTTFSHLIQKLGERDGKTIMVFSIDDFYLSYDDRIKLKQQDPRFQSRGPPGTHQINLLYQVFNQIKQKSLPIDIPIFDKSLHQGQGDINGYKTYQTQPDIVIFEGWFTGLRECQLQKLNPISTEEDLEFAKVCQQKLKEYYKLWDQIDSLLILTPEDYNYSRQWRKDAEHKMIAKTGKGMTDEQLDVFVDYFWKSLHPQIYINNCLDQKRYDLVVKLSFDHKITQILDNKPIEQQ